MLVPPESVTLLPDIIYRKRCDGDGFCRAWLGGTDECVRLYVGREERGGFTLGELHGEVAFQTWLLL